MELIVTYTVDVPDTRSNVKFKPDICLHSQIIAKKAEIEISPCYDPKISKLFKKFKLSKSLNFLRCNKEIKQDHTYVRNKINNRI